MERVVINEVVVQVYAVICPCPSFNVSLQLLLHLLNVLHPHVLEQLVQPLKVIFKESVFIALQETHPIEFF